MKAIALSLLAFGAFSVTASAEPVKLSRAQMDQVVAGALTTTTTRTNPAGNETQGKGQAITVTTVTTNPAGKAPPGANK
jgi:hypothetical protein